MSKLPSRMPACRRFVAVGLASLLPMAGAFAQEEDDIFVLTPFEVDAGEDTGYRASSTLAGTRMRMNLDDVGSSVSVFTKELIDDLAAVDNETLLAFGLGTEVGGARGNFVNPNSDGLENSNLLEPNANTRIRGLTSADNTRNYYLSDAPWDGYVIDRVDVQRGANSILFGVGSPAGIINASLARAGFRDRGQLQFRFDQFGSLRASADYNQALIKDELAIRVALLRDSRDFRQKPAFQNDERIYAALTYRPAMLNSETITTQFNLNWENANVKSNRPRYTAPIYKLTPFFLAPGESGFRGPDFAPGGQFNNNQNGIGFGGQPIDQVENWEVQTRGNSRGIPHNYFLSGRGSSDPVFFLDARNPNAGFTVRENAVRSRGSFVVETDEDEEGEEFVVGVFRNDGSINPDTGDFENNVKGVPEFALVDKQRAAANGNLAFQGFWRPSAFADTSHFDFYNNLIDGNSKLEKRKWDVLEFEMQNTFFNDRLGYQLGYFKQEMDLRQDAALGAVFAPAINVLVGTISPLTTDLTLTDEEGSRTLANPIPNAEVGRAFIEFDLRLQGGTEQTRDRDARRAMVYGTLDSKDFMDEGLATRLIGRHDFSSFLTNRRLTRMGRSFRSTGFGRPYFEQRGDSAVAANMDPADLARFTRPDARMAELSNVYGSVQPNVRVFLDARGPNQTNIQPFVVPEFPSMVSVGGFDATPRPGFTAGDAASETFIDPLASFPDENFQANNPANYVGWVDSLGTFPFVQSTDSREALEYLTASRSIATEDITSHGVVWTGRLWEDAIVGMYGWREDDVLEGRLSHNFGSTAASRDGQTTGAVFDPDSDFRLSFREKFQSTNWSVKANVTRLIADSFGWDGLPFSLSVLYNEGNVQVPDPGRIDPFFNDLGPASGKTIDRSLAISTRDGRYAARVTRYHTTVDNARSTSTVAREKWRIEQVLSQGTFRAGLIETDAQQYTAPWLSLSQEARDAGYVPTEFNEDGNEITTGLEAQFRREVVAPAWRAFEAEMFTRFPATRGWYRSQFEPGQLQAPSVGFPDNATLTEDQLSKGWEVELTARPTDNWNLTLNISKTDSLRDGVIAPGTEFGDLVDFIIEEMRGHAGLVPIWWFAGPPMGQHLNPFIGELIEARALNGTSAPEVRPWRVNLVTNYDFTEGFLDGFGLGAAARYEDPQIVGFQPVIVDQTTGALGLDLDQKFKDGSRETVDVWFKYKAKLTDRVDWRIQLNFQNVLNDRGVVPLSRNPDGSFGTVGIREGRSWNLSNTFSF